MRNAKYIVYESDYGKEGEVLEVIAIFPAFKVHADVARALPGKPISAGFVNRDIDGNLNCVGESYSLGLHSRGEKDTVLARKYDERNKD